MTGEQLYNLYSEEILGVGQFRPVLWTSLLGIEKDRWDNLARKVTA